MTIRKLAEVNELIDPLIQNGARVFAMAGSGGKTSLIKACVQHYSRSFRVGAAASAKMGLPDASWQDDRAVAPLKLYYDELVGGRKMHGVSDSKLDQALRECDLLFIEADGSKCLPLKGWRNFEPVIPKKTDVVLGLFPVDMIGMPASEAYIFHFPLFLKQSGLKASDPISFESLKALVLHPDGPFKAFSGKKVLVLTGQMTEENANAAEAFARDIKLQGIETVWMPRLHEEKIPLIVMASGLSRRMGMNKLMMTFNGKPLIDHTLELIDRNRDGTDPLVVTPFEDVAGEAALYHMTSADNPDHAIGQSRSIIKGIQTLPHGPGWIFMSGDMPFLSDRTFQHFINSVRVNQDKIVRVLYGGKPSLPVYFPRRYGPELLKLEGDRGGREIIDQNPDAVMVISVSDEREGKDLDTPEDFREVSDEKQ